MLKDKRKLIILAQSLEQPRVVKRIIEKSLTYESIEVYGFNRKIHVVKNFNVLNDYPNITLNILGSFSNSKYLSRIKGYSKLLFMLYKKHGLRTKQLYVFGLDLRMISALLINSKITYEISDIMWLYRPMIQRWLLKNIDAFLVRNSNKVTFTSKGFYDTYYKKNIKKDKVSIRENKFKTYGKVKPIETLRTDSIRIAYIGAFRYLDIIINLMKVVEKNNNLILNFYGDGDASVVELIKKNVQKNKNIFFNGAFKNPDDLEKIYAENNINFVVYNNKLDNEKVAMPNKFYESGYFNIPIVCAENTYVGKRVLEQNMGWTIGVEFDDMYNFFNDIKIECLLKKHNEIKLLDKSFFQY